MKLNYKRVLCVGFAFFLICLFWQAYDNIIPKILIDKFGMNQTWSGFIMALDNILSLFLLPFFGSISDRTKTKLGKRTPFILVGTICAVIFFIILGFIDNSQKKNLGYVTEYVVDDNGLKKMDSRGMDSIWNEEKDKILSTSTGVLFTLSNNLSEKEIKSNGIKLFTETEFKSIKVEIYTNDGKIVDNPDFVDFVTSARRAYAADITSKHKSTLVLFIVFLLLVLISMSSFRSPAVALMPDIIVKPLRSKANAIINLMGSIGAIFVLIMGILFSTGKSLNLTMSYLVYFSTIGILMLLALFIFKLTVNEEKFVKEMEEETGKYLHNLSSEKQTGNYYKERLTKEEKRSLIFLIISIIFWFMGYNAVTSKYSVYAGAVLNRDYNSTLIIAQAAAVLAYIPVGFISFHLGRKKTILIGISVLTLSFFVASYLNEFSNPIIMNVMFALAGIGWAAINVNSYPMVVELATGTDVGKYTGYYYTASMAAQTITPFLSGFLMDSFKKMTVLFPYAVIFTSLSFITMLFVKHGDSKPEIKTVISDAFSEN